MLPIFAYKQSKYARPVSMKREANDLSVYEDVIRSVGAPNKTVTYNAEILIGETLTNRNRRYFINTGLTVTHHQHQKYCEGVGGNFKFSVIKPFHNNSFSPLSYWCYAARFLDNIFPKIK